MPSAILFPRLGKQRDVVALLGFLQLAGSVKRLQEGRIAVVARKALQEVPQVNLKQHAHTTLQIETKRKLALLEVEISEFFDERNLEYCFTGQ